MSNIGRAEAQHNTGSRLEKYVNLLSPEAGAAVNGFYNPVIDPVTRDGSGVPQYTGGSSNLYSEINPFKYSYMDRADNPADKLYADLIRQQTRDYNARFAPLEGFLASEITATGTNSLAGDMGRTRDAVTRAGVNVEGQQQRAAGRYGLSSPYARGGASQVSALVGGLNDTKMRDIDRRQGLLTGSMSGITQKARGGV